MFYYTLIKISDNKNAVRTKEVTGITEAHPEVGKHFTIYSNSLDPKKHFRIVSTSIVKKIEDTDDENIKVLHTLNSKYQTTLTGTLDEKKEE